MGRPLALVTGYPGWLTGQLLRRLEQDPVGWCAGLAAYRWRAVVAPGAAPAARPAVLAEVVEGDLRDPTLASRAVAGVDLVLHAAGLIHPRRVRQLYQVNRDACRHLARAAAAAGVRRFLFVSSNAAAGFAGPEGPLREDNEPRPESDYGRSKLAGERALWEALSGTPTEGVVLRPTTFYGPHFPPRHLRAYRLARCGRPLVMGDGRNRVSLVYIDDLVDAVGLALSRPQAAAGTYFIADAASCEWLDVFRAMGQAQGVEVRPRHLPAALARLCAGVDRALAGLGLYSMMVHVAGEATRHMDCRIDRARADLGFDPRVGLWEGVRRAVAWARAEGWL